MNVFTEMILIQVVESVGIIIIPILIQKLLDNAKQIAEASPTELDDLVVKLIIEGLRDYKPTDER